VFYAFPIRSAACDAKAGSACGAQPEAVSQSVGVPELKPRRCLGNKTGRGDAKIPQKKSELAAYINFRQLGHLGL